MDSERHELGYLECDSSTLQREPELGVGGYVGVLLNADQVVPHEARRIWLPILIFLHPPYFVIPPGELFPLDVANFSALLHRDQFIDQSVGWLKVALDLEPYQLLLL